LPNLAEIFSNKGSAPNCIVMFDVVIKRDS
jgi:hypothetical protein